LLGGALGVALLSFSSAMVVARSFAAKAGYEVDSGLLNAHSQYNLAGNTLSEAC
jgi:hypothetical protein